MKMIRTLPTDKHGNVYHGPRTTKEGIASVNEMTCQPSCSSADAVAAVAKMMTDAGFSRAASGVRAHFAA